MRSKTDNVTADQWLLDKFKGLNLAPQVPNVAECNKDDLSRYDEEKDTYQLLYQTTVNDKPQVYKGNHFISSCGVTFPRLSINAFACPTYVAQMKAIHKKAAAAVKVNENV